jgi:hypothetical protein
MSANQQFAEAFIARTVKPGPAPSTVRALFLFGPHARALLVNGAGRDEAEGARPIDVD